MNLVKKNEKEKRRKQNEKENKRLKTDQGNQKNQLRKHTKKTSPRKKTQKKIWKLPKTGGGNFLKRNRKSQLLGHAEQDGPS